MKLEQVFQSYLAVTVQVHPLRVLVRPVDQHSGKQENATQPVRECVSGPEYSPGSMEGARETIFGKPGELLLAAGHHGAKLRWNAAQQTEAKEANKEAVKPEDVKTEEIKLNGASTATVTVAAV